MWLKGLVTVVGVLCFRVRVAVGEEWWWFVVVIIGLFLGVW